MTPSATPALLSLCIARHLDPDFQIIKMSQESHFHSQFGFLFDVVLDPFEFAKHPWASGVQGCLS